MQWQCAWPSAATRARGGVPCRPSLLAHLHRRALPTTNPRLCGAREQRSVSSSSLTFWLLIFFGAGCHVFFSSLSFLASKERRAQTVERTLHIGYMHAVCIPRDKKYDTFEKLQKMQTVTKLSISSAHVMS